MLGNSTPVLQLLRNSDKQQTTFNANRVAEILDSSTVDQCRHTAGADNPADLGTKGLSIKELMKSVWMKGPVWLKNEINETENWDQEELFPDREVFACNSNEKSAPIDCSHSVNSED